MQTPTDKIIINSIHMYMKKETSSLHATIPTILEHLRYSLQ